MDLQPELSSDQQLFEETSARFIEATCPLDTVRVVAEQPDGFDRAWWQQAAELGWTSMLAPERAGGGGISDHAIADLALVAFHRGRFVSPGPFVPTNVVLAAVAEGTGSGELVDELVDGLVTGARVGAVAFDEPGRPWGAAGVVAPARATSDGYAITGVKAPVEAGAQADVFLVAARADDGPIMALVPADAAGLTVTPRGTVDLVRRFATVELDEVAVPAAAVVGTGNAALDRSLDIANVLQLAETTGALDRVFEFTMEWAFDRYTFGRSLASYQELKHRFADMKLWLEASKATVAAAIRAVAEVRPDASELVSAAKSYVSEHGPELVQDCVQMHGGIGVTWDHDIHLYLRRVTVNSGTYGTARDHRERLAAIILEGS